MCEEKTVRDKVQCYQPNGVPLTVFPTSKLNRSAISNIRLCYDFQSALS